MTDSKHDDPKPEAKPEADSRLNRRRFLARLGAAAGVAYAAPSVLHVGGQAQAGSWYPFSSGFSFFSKTPSCYQPCTVSKHPPKQPAPTPTKKKKQAKAPKQPKGPKHAAVGPKGKGWF